MVVSIDGCFPLMIVFHWGLSSIDGHLPSKIVLQYRFSSIESSLPSKIISIKGCHPSKVIFHPSKSLYQIPTWLLYLRVKILSGKNFWEVNSPTVEKVVIRWWPSKGLWPSYLNTMIDLVFVSNVSIPNLSLLPCLEVEILGEGCCPCCYCYCYLNQKLWLFFS